MILSFAREVEPGHRYQSEDGGEVLGLDYDGFRSGEKIGPHLKKSLTIWRERCLLCPTFTTTSRTKTGFASRSRGKEGPEPHFEKVSSNQCFNVRGNALTRKLQGQSISVYAKQRLG